MKTIITWLKRAAMLSVMVAFAAAGLGANAATSSGLVHRWSFNGSLEDTVGGATAVTNGACSFTEDGKGVTLAGGSKGTSFVTLGACPNLLPSKSMTLEIWATQDAVQNWSRIFDFGSDQNNYLCMSWTRSTNLGQDAVEIISSYSTLISVTDTMQPYAIGEKWHISLTVSCNADGTSTLRWAKRDAATGALVASGSGVTSRAWTPDSFTSGYCYLGHSQYNDNDASATYDEVRIWNRVLSDAELDANAAAGPDGLMGDIMATPAVVEQLPSTRYVQSGLLAQWDAIDNAIVDGVRVHDDNAAIWTDLTESGHNFPVADYIGSQLNGWTATSLDAKSCYNIPAAVACTNYVTIEICARHNAADAIFFNSGDGGNKFAAYYSGRLQFYNYAPCQTIGNQAKTFQAAAVHTPDVSRPVVYTNAVPVASTGSDSWGSLGTNPYTTLGSGSDYYRFGGEYYAIRLYDRALTTDEIAQNAKLDAMRYLGDRSVAQLDDALEVAGSPIAIGAATPAYGISLGHGAGDTIACSVPATVTVGETRASCTGYTVTTNGAVYAEGNAASFTLEHPGVSTRLEWHWSVEYKVAATAGDGGSVSIAKQWFAPGETVTLTATPDEGQVFVAWLGVVPEAKRRDATLELEVASPVAVTAVFAPADVFTSETVFYNGETEQGDYAIATPEQLRLFHDRTTAGTTYEGSTFHILADIDLDWRTWSPCGTFSGVLDGHGHAIRNINIANSGNTGLFSILNGATVRNLSLRGGKMVMNAYNCIGGITGRVQGQSCVIEDLHGRSRNPFAQYIGWNMGWRHRRRCRGGIDALALPQPLCGHG